MGRIAALVACLAVCWWRPIDGVARIDQWHGLLVAAGLMVGLAWRVPSRGSLWRWVALWALPVAVIWKDAYGFAWLWLATWLLVCLACSKLDADPADVRWAVMVCAMTQLPLMLGEATGHTLWAREGTGLAGSLGKRHVLSALLGLCSLWSRGWTSWAWCLAAASTTSLTGFIPAGARLLWQAILRMPMRWRRPVGLVVGVLAAGGVCWALQIDQRLSVRLQVWQRILPTLWHPVGFQPLSDFGFLSFSLVDRLLHWQVYHSTVLELLARFGGWAVVLGVGLGAALRRRVGLWVAGWMATVLLFQSVEAYPAVAWFIGMAVIGERGDNEVTHGVGSV